MRTAIGMALLLAAACAIDHVLLHGRYTDQVFSDANSVGQRLNSQFHKVVGKLKF